MTIDEVKKLRESEDHTEFKEAKAQYAYNSKRRSVLGYVVALANEGGGKLIMGVKENKNGPHQIVGSAAWQGQEGKLEQDIYRDKHIRVSTEVLFEGTNRVLILHIPSRPVGKPLKFEDVPLMRVGEDLVPMSDEDYFKIIQEQEPDFSARICEGLTLNDLDPIAIEKMKEAYARKQQNSSFRSLGLQQVLTDLKLMVEGKLTYAALLLLGKRDQIEQKLAQAKTVWEFRFTEAQIHNDFREVLFDPLFTGIDRIWDLVNGKNGSEPVQSGAYIFTVNSFNEQVIREAILNAIVHRDYTISSEVVIKQYPKKIILNNPGGFPKGVTLENLVTISSTPRSRLMAEVLEKTGLVERSGQGVDKIFSITLSEGKPEPSYTDSDYYQVTLKLEGSVLDKAFSIYLKQLQDGRSDDQKLGVEEIIALHKVRLGQYSNIKAPILQKLEREGLVVRASGHTNRYTLGKLYYDLASKEQKIGSRYVTAEVELFLLALQDSILKIGELEEALSGSINRNQIKYLITKLYEDGVIESSGVGRGTRYQLTERFRSLRGDGLTAAVITSLREKYR